MRLAFFGTPQFATVTLQRLIESSHEVVLVVSQPDKPAGRGRKLTPPPVKQLAERAGIPVAQPVSAKAPEFAEQIRGLDLDVAIVVAYGQILPEPLLDIPKHGFLNIHGSLLPKYRGAAPIQWAIANGETETGVSIMQLDAGMDTGPVLMDSPLSILEDDDARSVHDALSVLGADVLLHALEDIEKHGHVHAQPQDNEEATYAPLITRDDARIDWRDKTENIICKVRGFVIWPGAWTLQKREKEDDREAKILGAEAVDPAWVTTDWKDERVPVGMVVEILKGRGFIVKTGSGLMLVTQVKLAGKQAMDATSAVNGGLVDVGSFFE